jgi:hypothetical protein
MLTAFPAQNKLNVTMSLKVIPKSSSPFIRLNLAAQSNNDWSNLIKILRLLLDVAGLKHFISKNMEFLFFYSFQEIRA